MFDDATREALARSPFVVVTICDEDGDDLRSAEALRNLLTPRGIVLLTAASEAGTVWRADASIRSGYVRDVWAEAGRPVLWLDPDVGTSLDPDMFDLDRIDFAVHDSSRDGGASAIGTPDFDGRFIWFGRSDAAEELLTCWEKCCREQPTVPDMDHLSAAWAQLPKRFDLKVRWLPSPAAGAVPAAEPSRGAGLSHSRSLFAPPAHPYCIWAPNYTERSAGIWALHALCHSLNLAGYPAYLLPTPTANPQWNTPLLTQELVDRYVALGVDPIVVYPEIVHGNPANASTVVRYVLNRPGHLTGAGMDEGPEDLLFYYSEDFIDDARGDEDLLSAPTVNTALFRPDPSRVRDKTIVFQYRYPLEKIDFSVFPPGTELLSMADPLALPDLARLFQGTKTLYSYELSNTCTLAMAAGCPVIYRTEGGLTEPPAAFLFGTDGAAMYDEPDGLERAIRTLPAARRAIAGMEDRFWKHLEVFVQKTQAAAARRRN